MSRCDSCVHTSRDGTGYVKDTTAFSLPGTNTQLMTSCDWAALLFCALLIGLAVAGGLGPGRRRHSALLSAVIGRPSLGICTPILLALL